ncbi:MAG: hypothetical protein H0U28_01355 [Nocardioidaceae bacterium]|nr:hypothetical protein [Nocardioidaceae bacterium]
MTQRTALTPASALNVAGLLAFGAMIIVQIAGGIDDYPTIPPGLVISLVVVALVVFVRRFWSTVIGALFPTALAVGGVLAEGAADRVGDTGETFTFVTSWLQLAALAVALVAGWAAVVQQARRR